MNNHTQSLTGNILNIQHFSLDDGPGIRTTVFLKGCPLLCAWCHNPESQKMQREYLYRADKCTGCGACAATCQSGVHTLQSGSHTVDRDRCLLCGDCIANGCDALEIAGKPLALVDVLEEVLQDRIFYKRAGGVTVSGGEPLMQAQFTLQLLKTCKEEGIHTCMETCGFGSTEDLLCIADHVDLFLFDYKVTGEEAHTQYTGVSNRLILHNLQQLMEHGASAILRCPMIPDVNMTQEHYAAIAALAERYPGIREVHLLPYHPMGLEKAAALGETAGYARKEFLEKNELEVVAACIRARTQTDVKVC